VTLLLLLLLLQGHGAPYSDVRDALNHHYVVCVMYFMQEWHMVCWPVLIQCMAFTLRSFLSLYTFSLVHPGTSH